MRTTPNRLPAAAMMTVATCLLMNFGVLTATGKKPVKPPPDPDPPSVGHRYTITVNEDVVFWGNDPLITGRIEDAQGETLLVNQGMVGGVNPYANLNELAGDQACGNPGDWSTCFLDPVDGTVQIATQVEPHFQFSFTARNRSGKKLWYLFEASATTDALSWDLYTLGVTESVSMALQDWWVEAGNGPLTKGCIGCGDFAGSVILTITRQTDSFMPEE